MVHTEVADGVHRVGHAHVSCYLLEDDDGLTLVDAGLPSFWPLVGHTLRAIGRRPADLRALAGAATTDVDQALRSLDAIADTGARTLLPGHGEPWTRGATAAVTHARDAGVA